MFRYGSKIMSIRNDLKNENVVLSISAIELAGTKSGGLLLNNWEIN
jgi:hypothetical protein